MKGALLVIVGVLLLSSCVVSDPVHVHLAYAARDDQMQVTFASSSACKGAYVLYGESVLDRNSSASVSHFTEGNSMGHQYIYNALLIELKAGQRYSYECVCGGSKSIVFNFYAKQVGNNWSPNLLVFGDMGRTLGPQALPSLLKSVKSGWPHAAVHVGDFAYDLDTLGGSNGDVFMNQIQDIAAYIPYMVCVGNHEAAHNFSHYVNRFNMPNTKDNMYFSWEVANAHFIAYSTEIYFDEQKYPAWTAQKQLEWLEQDLILANKNRKDKPWIITYGHRPMYCSNNDGDDCTKTNSPVRRALEGLFYKYGVDIIIEAHEHSYERLWPVYNEVVTQYDYINPKAPVHIITGVAGCNEDLGECINAITKPQGPWSAFRASGRAIYGYARMQIFNATHIYWEELEATKNDAILDSVWIVQNNHGPY